MGPLHLTPHLSRCRSPWLTLAIALFCGFSALAQEQQPTQQSPGTVTGTIIDRTGAAIIGANIKLSRDVQSLSPEILTDADGQFSFTNITPGPFQITVTAPGFVTRTYSGTLQSGEAYTVSPITLALAPTTSEVHVSLSPSDMAEAEIKDEEKQRVLGVIPNFYVTYNPSAVPLKPKQKFELAWKATIDPVNFALTGAVAGIEQASDAFDEYGQGAQGYGKRYGAAYADFVVSTFIGGAILPSLLKQDPRYFYKGTGTRRSRFFYAIAASVRCKGDNGHWQANYSGILGGLAAGTISNFYYPPSDRYDASLTFENALIGIGSSAANNLLQEFLIRKLTRNAPKYTQPTEPSAP